MKIKIITAILILAFLLSGWAPPPQDINATVDKTVDLATTYSLIVNNKTGQNVQLILTGPATYNFTVKMGKNTFTVQAGKYKYSYDACNKTKKGTVVVEKNNKLLTIAACKGKGTGGLVRVTVVNNTHGYMRLILTGPANYDFQLPTGKNAITVIRGKYQYTAYGCGASMSGTVNMRQGRVWTFFCY
jgi:hypothetical protein